MDRAPHLKDDAARHISHEQILQELRRKTKNRQSRERLKNLCCFLVAGCGVLIGFLILAVSEEPPSSPPRSVLAFHSTLVRHGESIMPKQVTSPIKVQAQGAGVCCFRLTFNNEAGTRRSHTAASCDGPMPDAAYEKTTIAGLGSLLGTLSRGFKETGSHNLH
jgi:hypothetical protein